MIGRKFERAIQFSHHAAKTHYGAKAHFSVEAHQFPEIAKKGKMGVRGPVVEGDGLLS